MSKQLTSAFQGITLDKHGSDCGTTKTLKVTLTKENVGIFKFRFIVEGKKLVLLTSENIDSYIGKTVNMRSPLYCKSKKMCNKCYGELPYKLGIVNIGLTFNAVGEKLKNLSMKAFHDMTVKLNNINIEDAITRL
jgi:hypothetical protein